MSSDPVRVEVITGNDEEAGAIAWMSESLGAFNQVFFHGDAKAFTTIYRREDGALLGGLQAWFIRGGSFFIDRVFVDESLRGQGIGSALMAAAEACAIEEECLHMRVTTFSFQAPKFYEGLGFSEIAALPGGREGDLEIFLMKELRPKRSPAG